MSRTARRLPLVLALTVATTAAAVAPAFATEDVESRRISGVDRYGTAAAIAETTFPAGSRVAVLASGERFPDALAASYMAGRLDAPLLLTAGASLSPAARDQLNRLGVDGVSVVGGAAAVSEAVVAELRSLGYEVNRTGGRDRYETARLIAEVFPQSFVGRLGDAGPTAIVASGEQAPDALAGAPISFSESFPVVLTAAGSLSADAARTFDSLDIGQVILLGGPSAVSAGVQDAIEDRGITVIRIAGQTREATAAEVADFEVDNLGWQAAHVNLARGDDFADALAGGPHEGVERAPVLLTGRTALSPATRQWLEDRADRVASIDAFGGNEALPQAVLNAAVDAATTP